MAIKTLRYSELYEIIWTILSSAQLLVTIKAEIRSNSELLKAAPTPRVAKKCVLDGYPLSRVQVDYIGIDAFFSDWPNKFSKSFRIR